MHIVMWEAKLTFNVNQRGRNVEGVEIIPEPRGLIAEQVKLGTTYPTFKQTNGVPVKLRRTAPAMAAACPGIVNIVTAPNVNGHRVVAIENRRFPLL